jgi:hypothetical protein
MTERGRGRLRGALLWLVGAGALVLALGDVDEPLPAPRPRGEADDGARLRIVQISDAEVVPGDAVVLIVDGLEPATPVEALVSRHAAPVLSRHDPEIVVRIPDDTASGKASVRLVQGERRSKPHDLLVRRLRLAKSLRNLVGGLALLLLGLQALARALRRLAGPDLRRRFSGLVRGTPRALGAGALVGATTQLTTSSAALIVHLLESELVAPAAAVTLLVGAHLGAAVTGALLPLAISRDSLLLVAVGLAASTLAGSRRGQAAGGLVAGLGLVLYGLHVVDLGVAPFVAHPATLPFVRFLERGDLLSIATCTLIGTLLAALLQGPGPLFGLVVGLLQVSGALGLTNALAMLAGTPLGAALGTALVAWPLGSGARAIAALHLRVGLGATVFLAASASLWARLALALAPGALDATAFGQRVLYPNAHVHLALGALAGQTVATLLALAALPWLKGRTRPRAAPRPRPDSFALILYVPACTEALRQVPLLCQQGDRNLAGEAERQLAAATRLLQGQLAHEGQGVRAPLVAALHLTRALAELVRVAEKGVERGVALAPAQELALAAAHALVVEGLAGLRDALHDGVVDLDAARAREIRLNAREAEARRELAAQPEAPASALWLGELLDAYEGVGNRVWRVLEAAALEVEDPRE